MSVQLRLIQASYLSLAMYAYLQLKKKKRVRSIGVRPIFRRRRQFGDGHNLVEELRFEDKDFFFTYTRMNVERFEYLLGLVGPLIKKRDMHTALLPSQRLAMTLRFLAAGDSQDTLSFSYRCAQSTVSIILAETTRAIVHVLKPLYLQAPSTEQEWKDIYCGFWRDWQFPHCIGAIDGKHIQIQSPKASQSLFFNYKKTFSLVLLAVCDSQYHFTLVDLGAEGSLSDGSIFASSEMGMRLAEGSLGIPPPLNLPGSNTKMPLFLVGDAAFPLKPYLMKPYAGRNVSHDCAVFNYRLSRGRRVIENTFGILAARWRVFHQPIIASTENVEFIVESAVCLHNFIRKTGDTSLRSEYCPPNFVDVDLPTGEVIQGEWREIVAGENGALCEGPRMGARNAALQVVKQRDLLKDYVNGPAAIPYQDNIVRFRQGLLTQDEVFED